MRSILLWIVRGILPECILSHWQAALTRQWKPVVGFCNDAPAVAILVMPDPC